jgi:pimeloyl-ACP methyl ester carboxylesterase
VVKAPTLLIVGGEDRDVIALNVEAKRHLVQCTSVLEIVPKATHLFEEPGALASVAQLASAWFRRHLGTARLSEPWEAPRL